MSSHTMNKGFFIDRDGIINELVFDAVEGIVRTPLTPDEVKFTPGIFDLLKKTKRMGYENIVISNQPNIGLTRMKKHAFEKLSARIRGSLRREGIKLDGEYYCFHHPYAKVKQYRKKCSCRKPGVGLFKQAEKDHDIDLKKSWMIGDGVHDVIAGQKAGCRTILLTNPLESEYMKILQERLRGVKPDHVVKNLREATKLFRNSD